MKNDRVLHLRKAFSAKAYKTQLIYLTNVPHYCLNHLYWINIPVHVAKINSFSMRTWGNRKCMGNKHRKLSTFHFFFFLKKPSSWLLFIFVKLRPMLVFYLFFWCQSNIWKTIFFFVKGAIISHSFERYVSFWLQQFPELIDINWWDLAHKADVTEQ